MDSRPATGAVVSVGLLSPPAHQRRVSVLAHQALAGRVGTGVAPVDRAARGGCGCRRRRQAVAIDGKTLCGTLANTVAVSQLLSLFDQRTGCVLSQLKFRRTRTKPRRRCAILRTLVLTGRVITADAMFCQPRDLSRNYRFGRRLSDRRERQPARTEGDDRRRFLAGIFPPRRSVSARRVPHPGQDLGERARTAHAASAGGQHAHRAAALGRTGQDSLKSCDWNEPRIETTTRRAKSSTPSPVFRPIRRTRRHYSPSGVAIGESRIANIGFATPTGAKTIAESVTAAAPIIWPPSATPPSIFSASPKHPI